MNTYRRFTCVQRSINFFLNQKLNPETETELIIFNTDVEHPLILGKSLLPYFNQIQIINNNTDYQTYSDYTNIGAIRRDSILHATGSHYICWDDDDVFLPWNIQQCVDGLNRNPDLWAWKPKKSLWWCTGKDPSVAENNMEASIIVNLERLREVSFSSHQGGGEHIQWLDKFQKLKKIIADKQSIPAYCFNWADQGLMRGHKQSGSIDRKDNFEHHKKETKDFATRPLELFDPQEINSIYEKMIFAIKDSGCFDSEIIDKYIK
jgi:hypothetical protein